MSSKSSQQIKKYSHLEHVLKLPDTVGSALKLPPRIIMFSMVMELQNVSRRLIIPGEYKDF